MDFSEAERVGFIYAFIDVWINQPDNTRTAEELEVAASGLLKGCAQHFSAQIQRVQKISGVVHPSQVDIFSNYARRMLEFEDLDEFTAHADKFILEFPLAENWIRWWIRPSHATMLFPSHRIMTEALWESLPKTTNAAEAQHFKIYMAVDKQHELIPGLECAFRFLKHYELLDSADRRTYPFLSCAILSITCLYDWIPDGTSTRYGKPEPWKDTAAVIGRTKVYRTSEPRGLNGKTDSRPPDTSKGLLPGTPKKRKRASSSAARFMACCPWSNNSCWLDTSLQLIWMTAERDYDAFEALFSNLPKDSFLAQLANSVKIHFQCGGLEEYHEGGCVLLRAQRDGLRKILVKSVQTPYVESISSYEMLFVSTSVEQDPRITDQLKGLVLGRI